MPMIDADGCLLNVTVEGRDGGPTLMLSNSLGCTLQMWEPQMKALIPLFRVIRYDRRGHGKSGVPPGSYSIERFGRDVLAILDDLNILIPRNQQELPIPQDRTATLKPDEKLVYNAIGDNETPIDTIISRSNLPSGRVTSTLLLLEMKRLVKQLPGQHFVKLG